MTKDDKADMTMCGRPNGRNVVRRTHLGRTRPRTMPLAMKTMKTRMNGSPISMHTRFSLFYSNGAPLAVYNLDVSALTLHHNFRYLSYWRQVLVIYLQTVQPLVSISIFLWTTIKSACDSIFFVFFYFQLFWRKVCELVSKNRRKFHFR